VHARESDLLREGEELIAGRRPVEEAFVARRPAHRLLVVPQRRQALEKLVLHATSLRVPVVEVEGGTLTALAGFDGHQGIALAVAPRTWSSPAEILARAVERGEAPFVLVLDSLEDPQNVGTLLRSAEAAGVHGVIYPTHRQAPLTPAAVKASAGAIEHLLLAPVDDLPTALSDLRIHGLRVAAAEADAPLTADEADLRGPLAIVVGSEGSGLSPAVRRRADLAIRIPMRGVIGSLNAAVAGSILLFAAVAQRQRAAEGGVPPSPEATDTPVTPVVTNATETVEAVSRAKPARSKSKPATSAVATATEAAEAPPSKAARSKTKAKAAAKPAAVQTRERTPARSASPPAAEPEADHDPGALLPDGPRADAGDDSSPGAEPSPGPGSDDADRA
jgi:23S rRNA (guanosine2251-2'-O)-methyltransferase